VPYQLHCCALAQTDEATELDKLLNTLLDERTDEDGAIEDEGTLEDEILDGITLDRTEDATELWAPQTAPVTTGISTAPLVLTCTPKDTVFPGWTLSFQLKFDAL
jgi:hypothetical protein